jgi:hypothetical protein
MTKKNINQPKPKKPGKAENNNTMLTIHIPRDMRSAFKSKVAKMGQSMSDLVRDWIEDFLKDADSNPDDE